MACQSNNDLDPSLTFLFFLLPGAFKLYKLICVFVLLSGANARFFFSLIEGLWGAPPPEDEPEDEPAAKRSRPEGVAGPSVPSECKAFHPDFVLPTHRTQYLVVEGEDLRSAGIPKKWQPVYEKRDVSGGKYYSQICEHATGNRDSAFTHARRHLAVELGCPHCPSYGVTSHDAWEKHMKLHPNMRHRVDPASLAGVEAVPAPAAEAEEVRKIVTDIKKEPDL